MKKEYLIAGILLAIGLILYLTRNKIGKLMSNAVISDKIKKPLDALLTAAGFDGIPLYVVSGLRTKDEQLALRRAHVIDKSKVNDINYLMTAPSSKFNPVTAAPGTSNHETGLAIDFNVTGNPKNYAWLLKNAHKFGFVRTVPSEKWHWEYRPGSDMYAFIPKTHVSWEV